MGPVPKPGIAVGSINTQSHDPEQLVLLTHHRKGAVRTSHVNQPGNIGLRLFKVGHLALTSYARSGGEGIEDPRSIRQAQGAQPRPVHNLASRNPKASSTNNNSYLGFQIGMAARGRPASIHYLSLPRNCSHGPQARQPSFSDLSSLICLTTRNREYNSPYDEIINR